MNRVQWRGWMVLGRWTAACLLAGPRPVSAAAVVDFEDLVLPPESYYNGSDAAGGFTTRGAHFHNSFTDYGGGFVAWSGWAYSNGTDHTTPGFNNQYGAITGEGAGESDLYGVTFPIAPYNAAIELPPACHPASVVVTNTTYAYFSMLNGDAFAKPFGGPSGDDPDYFLLRITGFDDGDAPVGAVEFYLADYRFDDSARDYIVDAWIEVDLTDLHAAATLTFELESSDVGPYGINTPTYFALDNLVLVPEPATLALLTVGAGVAWFGRPRHARWRQHHAAAS